jgi:hypothetical protein
MKALANGVIRYAFRFVLFYWVCFTFPFPLDLLGLPFSYVDPKDRPTWMTSAGATYSQAYSWITKQKDDACVWVGDRVLHVEAVVQPTGSGDTIRAYVGCLCAVAIAVVAALLWTLVVWWVQRQKPDWDPDSRLHGIVRVVVRFFLCQMFLGYGFAKVFPLQFAAPSSSRLEQQLGDMSPMGLLWTFMGFSPTFQIFTGSIEVLAGLLLTTRRTTLLGSLVALAAMTQVFMMNMCFDVPVKLYSLHYLMMAMFLLAPGLPRLIDGLVLGKAVEAMSFVPLLGSAKFDKLAQVLRAIVVFAMVFGQVQGSRKFWNDMYGGAPAPVAGRWDVVSVEVDKKKPVEDDPMNWKWLDFSNRKFIRLAGQKPPNTVYLITWDTNSKKLTLKKFSAPEWSATFSYDAPEPDKLELQGSMDGKPISATLKRAPDKRYELMNRGFKWIQELPYNR